MKLTSTEESGVQVLIASGGISKHEFAVLKAGVTRLFRAGRNRIVLELQGSSGVDEEVIRELGQLNSTARELSGEIALVVEDDSIRAKIDAFAKPRVVWTFAQRQNALKSLEHKIPFETEEESSDPAYFGKLLEAKDQEILKLKEQLRAKDGRETQDLKKEVARLRAENGRAEERIIYLVRGSGQPPADSVWLEKVQTLESQLAVMIKKLDQPAGPTEA